MFLLLSGPPEGRSAHYARAGPLAASARTAGLRGARPSVPPDANGVDASGAQPAVRALMET
ncbi:hypothetical protein HMPREF0043_01820 [Actinobaculum sp. oral taxon 183 str. F0552]|nr:hypothetical protein HMPREF0043_01820 [Actinobaculum sp. oral taxon 183 str. F0552]